MTRYALALALISGGAAPLTGQTLTADVAAPIPPIATATTLPDAPSTRMPAADERPVITLLPGEKPWMGTDEQAARTKPQPVADRFATIILPGQQAAELHGMQKAVYGLHDSFSLPSIAGFTISAGWSHLIDSQPHYGRNAEAFGKREGAAALRSTIQTMTTDAIFSPMFHDDPRYYELGNGHSFFARVGYAASRVVVTRSSHSTKQRFNAPLLLGYGVTAATNNIYYPDRDRGGQNTMANWGTSLIGAALSFEVSEFLDDALHAVHIRRD